MTEPAVASSDATNIQSEIRRHGNHYVLNGHKWWISGAVHPNCDICIFMGKTDPSAAKHKQQVCVCARVCVCIYLAGISIKTM